MAEFMGIALLAMALLLAGCGQDKGAGGQGAAGNAAGQTGQNASSNAGNGAQGEQGAKRTVYPLTLKDSSGTEFTFESAPQKSFLWPRRRRRRCSRSGSISRSPAFRIWTIIRKR